MGDGYLRRLLYLNMKYMARIVLAALTKRFSKYSHWNGMLTEKTTIKNNSNFLIAMRTWRGKQLPTLCRQGILLSPQES